MKCCENVIVTVRIHPGGAALDMEMPAFLAVRELETHFLETVHEMDPLHYSTVSTAAFRSGDRLLEADTTLAGAGVWDGAILDVQLSEEV